MKQKMPIGFFTAQVRQLFGEDLWLQSVKPNDFDAHWEN
jgi:hypothetical protein